MNTLATIWAAGWRPFLEPINAFHEYWLWLLLPLTLGIAVVWKALKLEDLKELPAQTLRLTATIILCMGLAAVLLWVVIEMV